MIVFANKCVIYARVSTVDKQEYDRQIDELKKFASSKNLDVAEIFAEKISGLTKASDRPAFNEMLKFIEENEIHHILVSELSRLGRKMRDTINIIQDFNERSICVHVLNGNLSTLDKNFREDKVVSLIINILTSFADIERDTITERIKSGLRYNAKMGGSGSGIIKPYGYKKEGKKLVVDDEEAEIIKFIFNKYIDGLGSGQIADLLNEKRIKTKYNKLFASDKSIRTKTGKIKNADKYVWRNTTIINILRNTIYIGERKYQDEIFKIEPIIDRDTFFKVEKLRKERQNKKNFNVKYDNIFQGKIICPVCDSNYYMHKRPNNADNAYKCLSKRLKEVQCNNISINIDKLNNAVYYLLKDTFKVQAIFDKKFLDKTHEIEDEITKLNSEKNQLAKELESLEKQIKNLTRSHVKDDLDKKTYTELKNEIYDEMRKIKSKIEYKNEELEKNKSIIKTLNSKRNKRLDNANIFKRYIKDYITFIKIYNVTDLINLNEFGKYFSVKNDVIGLVEVKCDLISSYYTFLISRYSKYIIELDLNDTENLNMKIPYLNDYQTIKVGNEIKI